MTKPAATDEHKAEAARLKALGYRRTSNRYRMLSRIDRPDWLLALAEHLRRSPASLYIPDKSHPDGMWCDYYRRVLSKDTIEVSPEVCHLVGSSDHDTIGYVIPEGETMPEPFRRQGQTVYRLVETGYRRGEPVLENEFTILVQRGKGTTDEQAQELAERIRALLNGEPA